MGVARPVPLKCKSPCFAIEARGPTIGMLGVRDTLSSAGGLGRNALNSFSAKSFALSLVGNSSGTLRVFPFVIASDNFHTPCVAS